VVVTAKIQKHDQGQPTHNNQGQPHRVEREEGHGLEVVGAPLFAVCGGVGRMRQMQLVLIIEANANHAEDHMDKHLVTIWGVDGLPQTVLVAWPQTQLLKSSKLFDIVQFTPASRRKI